MNQPRYRNSNPPGSAQGHWHLILPELGVDPSYLTGKHTACPICKDGKDRFRWDNKDGRGTYICNKCGAGDGFNFLQSINGWDYQHTASEVDKFLERKSSYLNPAIKRGCDNPNSECYTALQERAKRARAAEKAKQKIRILNLAGNNHPYLSIKQVQSHGLYACGRDLIIPVRTVDGDVTSYQQINPGGGKRFLSGGRIKGCFHVLGELTQTVFVCEGYATAATLHEATHSAVICAFNAGNLKPVCLAMSVRFPNIRIIVAADNDQHLNPNIGVEKATAAAQAVNGFVVVPYLDGEPTKPCDFNDLAILQGLSSVRGWCNV